MYFKGVLLSLLVLAGCSVSRRAYFENGQGEIPEELFQNIQNRQTELEWLTAHLGAADYKQDFGGGVEVHSWQFARSVYTHASLMLLFRYNTLEQDVEYLHIVASNGRVQRYWRDAWSHVQERIVRKILASAAVDAPAPDQTALMETTLQRPLQPTPGTTNQERRSEDPWANIEVDLKGRLPER